MRWTPRRWTRSAPPSPRPSAIRRSDAPSWRAPATRPSSRAPTSRRWQTRRRTRVDVLVGHAHRLADKLEASRLPVIAAVNGFALGGGLELALACDFIFAARGAKLGLPEVGLGVIPGLGGTQRLARRIGVPRARELIYRGALIEAEEAMRLGFVNAVVEREELMPLARTAADEIATRAPLAVAAAKQVLRRGADATLDAGVSLERHLSHRCSPRRIKRRACAPSSRSAPPCGPENELRADPRTEDDPRHRARPRRARDRAQGRRDRSVTPVPAQDLRPPGRAGPAGHHGPREVGRRRAGHALLRAGAGGDLARLRLDGRDHVGAELAGGGPDPEGGHRRAEARAGCRIWRRAARSAASRCPSRRPGRTPRRRRRAPCATATAGSSTAPRTSSPTGRWPTWPSSSRRPIQRRAAAASAPSWCR